MSSSASSSRTITIKHFTVGAIYRLCFGGPDVPRDQRHARNTMITCGSDSGPNFELPVDTLLTVTGQSGEKIYFVSSKGIGWVYDDYLEETGQTTSSRSLMKSDSTTDTKMVSKTP